MPEQQSYINQLYPMVFGTPEGQKVLADIHKYTRYRESCFSVENERVNCFSQGQQDVSVFIQNTIEKEIKRSLNNVKSD